MIDLPIVPASTAPGAAARQAANSPQRDAGAQPDESAFQAALAQELEQTTDGRTLTGPGVRAATHPAVNPLARSARAPADDALIDAVLAQELGLTNDGRGLPVPGVTATAAKRVVATDANARRDDDAARPAAAGDPSLPPLGSGAFAPALGGASISPPEGTGLAASAFESRQEQPATASVAANAASRLPAALAAADFAASGNFLPAAEGEVRREFALAASLPDQYQPMPAAAIDGGNAAPAQVTQASVTALEPQVGGRGWDRGLGDKLVWMASQSQQVAHLHLNPPELGPLQITLTLNHDQASAQFVSAHALVRDAIEAAMPRLREMLADSGITLGNASVGADAFREQAQPQPQHEPRNYASASDLGMADSAVLTRGTQHLRLSRGLVDTFA